MATSPIYSWPEPDNTDLVKNGALAIRTLGNAIDTTMGTMVAKTVVDAKGDLIAGTAADTVNRLAVGNNGETLVADSSTSTGLRWQGTQAAGKNTLINGNFDIWQRGTSFTNNAYSADRWYTNAGEAQTVTRQTSGAPNGSQYYWRSTATQSACFFVPTQLIETSQAANLWGKTVTFSVLLRRNATMNSDVSIGISKSSTVDASVAASWTSISTTTVSNATIPTGTTSADWYKASVTVAIPNDGTANTLWARIVSGSSANGSVLEISQAQIELGSVATAFTRAGGTLQGELAACQRYYWRSAGGTTYTVSGFGFCNNTTTAYIGINLPVPMRSVPASVEFSAQNLNDAAANYAVTAISMTSTWRATNMVMLETSVASGLTQYRPIFLTNNNNTAGYVGLSAEL